MNILLTGGAGFVGSHIIVELYKSGHTAVIADNLSNSSHDVLHRLGELTGAKIPFYEIDVREKKKLKALFAEERIDAVVHLAGSKAVGESVEKPLEYYANNIDSTLVLLDTMAEYGIKKIIFSSSATVYGTPKKLPLSEDDQVGIGITNPYGKTKYFIEEILKDAFVADAKLAITILRYFNPIGAHESGLIGEKPQGIPNNLMPFISQVAIGQRPALKIFGNDYDTPDGTGVRDYIHISDLARGHVAALEQVRPGVEVYNLGTGEGISVLQLVKTFEQATGKTVSYEITPRRAGDIATCYASSQKSFEKLGWKTEKTIVDMCVDAWRWQENSGF